MLQSYKAVLYYDKNQVSTIVIVERDRASLWDDILWRHPPNTGSQHASGGPTPDIRDGGNRPILVSR